MVLSVSGVGNDLNYANNGYHTLVDQDNTLENDSIYNSVPKTADNYNTSDLFDNKSSSVPTLEASNSLEKSSSLWSKFKGIFTGRDYYKTLDGVDISMKKGTGSILQEGKEIYIANGSDIHVNTSKKNANHVLIRNSQVSSILLHSDDNLDLSECVTKGAFVRTRTSGAGVTLSVDGDFDGNIYTQQSIKFNGIGADAGTEDTINIYGNNNGYLQVDKNDNVYVSGNKGVVKNRKITYIPGADGSFVMTM